MIAPNRDGTFHLTGTLLNGISAGAAYGDDAQMDSNYPLVRLNDATGTVYYARTFQWSSTGVMLSNTVVATEFVAPSLPRGAYSLVVVANGISSDPTLFYTPDALQIANVGGEALLSWPLSATNAVLESYDRSGERQLDAGDECRGHSWNRFRGHEYPQRRSRFLSVARPVVVVAPREDR